MWLSPSHHQTKAKMIAKYNTNGKGECKSSEFVPLFTAAFTSVNHNLSLRVCDCLLPAMIMNELRRYWVIQAFDDNWWWYDDSDDLNWWIWEKKERKWWRLCWAKSLKCKLVFFRLFFFFFPLIFCYYIYIKNKYMVPDMWVRMNTSNGTRISPGSIN